MTAPVCDKSAEPPERTCATCRHVRESLVVGDRMDQRCSLYRVGKRSMLTWTATHNPKKCGSGRASWEPPPSEEQVKAREDRCAEIMAAGGPQAALLTLLSRGAP